MPQTEWAPAWVAWREGGGYTGWAPLPPQSRMDAYGAAQHREQNIDPHTFVFVEERKMLEPQHPQTVIVNNSTIIQKTVNITKIVVVNKTVFNEGPSPEIVATASGRKVDVKSANALRTRQEAPALKEHRLRETEPAKNSLPPTQNRQDVQPKEPYIAKPYEIKSTGTNMVLSPKAKSAQADKLDYWQPQTNQSPGQTVSGQFKPELNSKAHLPIEHRVEIKTNGQVTVTPQQKLELEKKKKAIEKHEQRGTNYPSSTNSPIPPK